MLEVLQPRIIGLDTNVFDPTVCFNDEVTLAASKDFIDRLNIVCICNIALRPRYHFHSRVMQRNEAWDHQVRLVLCRPCPSVRVPSVEFAFALLYHFLRRSK